MEKLTACQTYENKDFSKVYFQDKKGNIKRVVIHCKAKNLNKAI